MSDELITIDTAAWPAQMIADMAVGLDEPVDIAFRYGIRASEFKALEQNPRFLAAVAMARSEFERSGHGVKVKAQWMTDNLMDDLYVRAKSPHASISQLQDSIKILSKLADLEPKGNAAPIGGGGPTSTVQIIFNNSGATAEVVVGGETVKNEEPLVWEMPAGEVTDADD